MRIQWTTEAYDNLEGIQEYIAKDDPLAAFDVVDNILDRVDNDLTDHPEIGRQGLDLPNTRELIIAGTPYIVVYTIHDDVIAIAQVRHGAQLWPPEDADG